MKTFAQLAGIGLVGFVAFKLLGALIAPILGLAAGLLALVIKVALVMALGWGVLRLFRGRPGRDRKTA